MYNVDQINVHDVPEESLWKECLENSTEDMGSLDYIHTVHLYIDIHLIMIQNNTLTTKNHSAAFNRMHQFILSSELHIINILETR